MKVLEVRRGKLSPALVIDSRLTIISITSTICRLINQVMYAICAAKEARYHYLSLAWTLCATTKQDLLLTAHWKDYNSKAATTKEKPYTQRSWLLLMSSRIININEGNRLLFHEYIHFLLAQSQPFQLLEKLSNNAQL